ncbi:MAG TPA: ABC transporter substrate-binding protein [Geminicoccaceae bacterium]|nr:ABC transporter substrate-binding protein [Geminicoccaceae bacterium]
MSRAAALTLALALLAAPAATALADSWDETLARARGQTVYFNAWGGDEQINAYIAWVGEQVRARQGVELVHVKLTDTAEAVARVLAEKAAGRTEGGSVDLIWINGENFAAMKERGLLFGPFAQDLPNFRHVDTEGKPTTLVDFTVPTGGLEAPWGMAQFVFIHDTARVAEPPRSIPALLAWAEAHPGRFTYPAPPDFVGSTFLKHALLELTPDPDVLQRPAEEADVARASAPLWSWLEAIRPHLWRGGRGYPASGPAQHQLLDDGEVDFSLAFNPAEASRAILDGRLPETVRTFILEDGTIGNTHFVAIPFNAEHKEGALAVANFLLSPEAQARKQHPEVWGDGTVLDLDRLSPEDRALFDALPRGVATLPPEELEPVRLEPHPSWMTLIEEEWLRRFSS